MESVIVVAFLVSCSTNLVECRQLSTDQYHWRTPPQCEAALPELKRRYRSFGHRNVLGKCHYLLDEDHRFTRSG